MPNRRFAEVVRIEVHPSMPESLRLLLVEEFNADQEAEGVSLSIEDVYEVAGPLDAAELSPIASLDFPELKDPAFAPVTPQRLATARNIFEVIRDGDVLVHHPYESFTSSVERFIQAATDDPDVLAIKLTLYRIGADSTIARLLQQAASAASRWRFRRLRARFDEESNIRWAKRLEDVGVHVSYGIAGLKKRMRRSSWWCAGRGSPSIAMSIWAPATTPPALRGSTPISGSSPPIRTWAPICPTSSTSSPASPILSASGRSSWPPATCGNGCWTGSGARPSMPGPAARGGFSPK